MNEDERNLRSLFEEVVCMTGDWHHRSRCTRTAGRFARDSMPGTRIAKSTLPNRTIPLFWLERTLESKRTGI